MMTEPATPAKTLAAASLRSQTRSLWLAIAVVAAVGVVATATFGYPALILLALGGTLLVFVALLLIMRG